MNAELQKHPAHTLTNLNRLLPDLQSVYKDLHPHPELSMQENRTAGLAIGISAWS
jgi:metal-dependent amidase/aminoacylase/carboxypeptidase family protein